MRTKDLHEELVAALMSAGAVPPGPLFPPGYKGQNADALFVNERAVVEVKSICDDHAAAEQMQTRLAPWFAKWAKEADFVVFGTVGFKWDDYPEWLQHKIEDLTAPSVIDQLEKSNRQLRETQRAIGWDASYGIVAFVVPSGFNVDPWVIGRIAWQQLHRRQGHFPHIDAVIIITVPVDDQPSNARVPMYVPIPRRNEAIPHKLASRIRDAWLNRFADKSGGPVLAIGATEEAFLEMQTPPIRLTFDV